MCVVALFGAPGCHGDKEPPATTTTIVDPDVAFCEVADELSVADPFAAVEAATSPEEAKRAFDAALEKVRPLVEVAPKAIADAAEAYVDGFEAYGALLAAADYNGSKVDRDQLAVIVADFGHAQADLEAYAVKNCT